MDETERGRSFFDGCIMTYGAATRHMAEVWESVTGRPMGKLSGYPKDRFREALGYYVGAIRNGSAGPLRHGLRDATDGDAILRSLLEDSLEEPGASLLPDMDDVPPSVFKKAIWDEALWCAGDEPVDVDLDVFLRGAVARVIEVMHWERRINVGRNRHFPRMFQWLREVQDESIDEDGAGLWIMNRSSAGRVAAYPTDPHALKVRLDVRWL